MDKEDLDVDEQLAQVKARLKKLIFTDGQYLDDDAHEQSHIVINGKRYSNITIIDQDREPIAIITPDEIIALHGYGVLFDVGED